MQLLDGKAVASSLAEEMRAEVQRLVQQGQRPPCLVAVLVGDNPASKAYVASKEKKCLELGFSSRVCRFEESVSEAELLAEIGRLNRDPEVDGFIVQLPLPGHIDERKVTQAIDPRKDVDGFHPTNLGLMMLGLDTYLPATPYGILRMLQHYEIPTKGKHLVVLGRSHIVGLPVANMLVQKAYPGDCTVTICHSRTQDLEGILRQADILIVAMGVPEFLRADMVKEGAVVIDVGINRVDDPSRKSGYRLVGDVAFDEVAPKTSYISPVPGGVGPMTIITLMYNTLKARRQQL
ncbi:MAG: bifunctional 5,10-methylene-tetrahydrofolate dehydrogenase/5,10-methylene-tetrahydrofolate cyclohydrolase [Bacteroidia bacterium]|nr:MAG: bifunctional 5,10-methylene-tetrahydrofolate dehydrogenase/5,10-methylene-tetrahydrofolate cyclohydrolase [Bacteroidia bacterium]